MAQLTAEQRSKIMASIHSKNTKPEMMVRRYLFACGFRYRVNCRRLHQLDTKEKRERTLMAIEYTLNHIFLMDRKKAEMGSQVALAKKNQQDVKPYRLSDVHHVSMAAEEIHRD